MIDHELLRDLTESYLKSLISEASGMSDRNFDSSAPFGELGINSFQVLKIIKTLEADFGTLPKSLLFENFNINDLAGYFVCRHEQTLSARFTEQLQRAGSPARIVHNRDASGVVEHVQRRAEAPAVTVAAAELVEPLRMLEKDAWADPELNELVRTLRVRYGSEGCVSRGTRKIAPNLFIGSERRGYFNYSRRNDIILVYGYAGPADYLPVLAAEMYRYCQTRGFQLNVLGGDEAPSIGGTPFSATPFGVMQRIVGLGEFRLDGGAMRRLRYQVSKFEKAGRCRTEEYRPGSSAETDQEIAAIIDRWCESKTVVNPLIYDVRGDVLAGALAREHRLFVTYLDDVMQNAILITAMSDADPGYLMDLEFYRPEMPLGGLEYAIVRIIDTLVSEGCDVLSLGGTYGVKLAPSASADPGVESVLDDLRAQGIFNDEGNLQFKNKFRPRNTPIFLSRPVGSADPDNVLDIIMMIADPLKMQTPDAENHNAPLRAAAAGPVLLPARAASPSRLAETAVIAGSDRSRILADAGFNPLNLAHEHVDIDLKTDSWAQLRMPSIDAQVRHLRAQLQQSPSGDDSIRAIFPFAHSVLTTSGQAAESVFFKAWAKKGLVLQNLLFPSTIFHEIDKGFANRELPTPAIFETKSDDPYKGNVDFDALQAHVAGDPGSIAFVCLELANNAAGGAPVSLAHLRALKGLLSRHSIPLVLDGTRVVENAQLLVEREPECAGRSVWTVVREIFSHADAVIGSLTKDFCVATGGIVATNDAALFGRLQELADEEGAALDAVERRLVAASLSERGRIEAKVLRRMDDVRRLGRALADRGVPIVHPEGGHCVLVDVRAIPEFRDLPDPVASFVAWLYLSAGIRAAAHSVGMQKKTPINDLVRLAVPVGMKRDQIDRAIDRLGAAFDARTNIPELVREKSAPGPTAGVYARYELVKYHNLSVAVAVAEDGATPPPLVETPEVTGATADVNPPERPSLDSGARRELAGRRPRRNQEIAIVGMAGRYPKAKNLTELWENLVRGRDCIETIPPERLARRRQYESTEPYRGGFIDDVDRFDSLFFNVSPREAEMLDPQERLFLEVAWEAIEDGGYYPEILAREDELRNIGVYVGAVWAMYQIVGVDEKYAGNAVAPNSFLWSIANRVSYWMNLSGPSLTVDTACSSSLTALYLACEALYAGECSAAIVGGVNLDLHQAKLDINLVGGALSPDGVCRTFGKGANGYVAGEGIGALFLKPLDQAERDRDHIYGVIRSAAVNHGGRTSGYFVPNPAAQGNVIASALRRAGVSAPTIGYIEAHGTGTELGDPIEIAGLSNAFGAAEVASQTCAIGSIKTNIGHLEAAAGVVSVSKVLLQMRHRKLVPSLHSSELNGFIDFEHSPFYVVQNVEEWRAKELDGRPVPLRAGISSFGAGGANAHVIIESYEPVAPRDGDVDANAELIFPLSARNEEQLREAAVRLASFLRTAPVDLHDAAYTLQHGRKSFEHRVAIVAKTQDELIEKLTSFVDGRKDDAIATGHVKLAETVTRLLNRREKQELVQLLSRGRDPRKIAALWAEGMLADWQGFQAGASGRRMPLPTYPFAGKRHWVGSAAPARRAVQSVAGVHPMVDSNESTFERQLFRKTFHDRDFFMYDHHVSDIPTLPGVAYLELARKAGELAAGRPVRRIQNILWVSPIAIEGSKPKEVFVELKPAGEAVQFEVFSEAEGKKTLHSQGKLLYTPRQEAGEPERLDLDAIRARCAKSVDAKGAYPLFKSVGLDLGPSFQVLHDVRRSEAEVLGELHLPEARQGDLEALLLHPSLIDGSLQAGMAARLGDSVGEMLVPYSIGEVEILHPLQPRCFSYTTEAKDGRKDSRVLKSNVLIVDESGQVLVRIRESTGVPIGDVHRKTGDDQADESFWKLYYAYEWEPSPLPETERTAGALQSILLFDTGETLRDLYRARLADTGEAAASVILVRPGDAFGEIDEQSYEIDPRCRDDFTRLLETLAAKGCSIGDISFAWTARGVGAPDETHLDESLDRGVISFLFLCQAVIKSKLESTVQVLHLHSARAGEAQPHNEAVSGFVNTLRGEYPKLLCRTVEVRQETGDAAELFDAAWSEQRARTQDANVVRYESGQRFTRKLKVVEPVELATTVSSQPTGPKEGGVYVITGGAGGLGLIFAEYLAREYGAKLVLTGRSELPDERRTRLDELERSGAEILYTVADVSRREDVEALVGEARRRFGEINGVIHSAGVLRDSYVHNKTAEEMRAVFAPKVHGTLHLDEATKDEPLDFFVMFSSLAAVTGNPGQCDYSFANSFMDAFAAERERLRESGRRHGRSLSINWSLWADGGMKPDDQTVAGMKKILGMKPLSTATGLEAFVSGLASGRSQFAVLEADREKLELAWGGKKKSAPAAEPAAVAEDRAQAAGGSDASLVPWLQNELSQIVIEFLKLDAADVSTDKVLLDLGFDSLGLTTFANTINEKFQLDITPILFFDYPSIGEIAKHLAAEHSNALLRVRGATGTAVAAGSPAAVEPASTHDAPRFEIRKGWTPAAVEAATEERGVISPEHRFANEPIAIVGMSGVMPQSDDLDEFWDNLANSRDLVTEIPRDRWQWEDYFGDPLREANKSNSKWGGFIRNVDQFDPLFFGISPREAQMMDPQQRLFLEHVWKAIEDSGQKVSDLSGTSTGLFVGVGTTDYSGLLSSRGVALDGYTASGNSHSVTANRVSFMLNLRGPSAPIDTACSSSLVAFHRALESIHTGSCDMAIVGGVQVMLSPAAFISFSSAGMLSPDGKCKTFDKQANGYVRGEGCGAVFLKRLSDAEADGNHIYAVIKATAENHGGRVTTMTAPNSAAQTELLIEAYEKANVDPTTVGFIECHGTGTGLGDPIEIQALTKAFSDLYKKHGKPPAKAPHCGLSSVKTNIGHLETGAGIAGVLKALLAIRNRQIPANLHLQEINPYINLEGTPFYIADKLTPWDAPTDESGRPLPRRAGVSSFGFGGANAHVVLEEYIPAARPRTAGGEPQLIVLSAKNEERLAAYVASLRTYLDRHEVELADLAYTLQVGRDEMAERLALVASSTEELKQKLDALAAGPERPEKMYRARVKKGAAPADDAKVRTLIERKDLVALAELWVSGAAVDWRLLHPSPGPRRISAPTYPFARERYWIPETSAIAEERHHAGAPQIAHLHPLVHRNVSTLKEQKFASRFAGTEFYLADHAIRDEAVLPAVAYVEIAAAAGELSAERSVRFIRNMSWLAPITVGAEGREVEVSLSSGRNEVEFAVRTLHEGNVVTHCRGELAWLGSASAPAALDLATIRSRCSDGTIAAAELYPFLGTSELILGRGFQVVREIHAGGSECLAVLQLPEHVAKDADRYRLHPALLDGALHSAIGMVKRRRPDLPWSVPYSVAEIEIFGSLHDAAFAHASWDLDGVTDEKGVIRMQLHLLDANGRVLVRMRDFVARPFVQRAAPAYEAAHDGRDAATGEENANALQLLWPLWSRVDDEAIRSTVPPRTGRIVLLGGGDSELEWLRASSPSAERLELPPRASVDEIEQALRGRAFDQLVWIAPDVSRIDDRPPAEGVSLIEQQEDGVIALFRIVKALLHSGHADAQFQWTLITSGTAAVAERDRLQPAHAAVIGFAGSLAKEYPRWGLRLLDVDSLASVPAEECLSLRADPHGNALARRGGVWFQQGLELAPALPTAAPAYRQNGVYVVVGGAGGVGEAWSRFMIERHQASIVWIGRRECDAAIAAKIDALARLGPAPSYIAADATDAAALEQARRQILETHPAIHGVVHSAIVLRDQSILNMDERAFRDSLAAKVDVSVNIDRVFGGDELDFVLFFSSIVSFFKSPGQSNYAAGCCFKDAFAEMLGRERAYRAATVNWGYWGSVGVVADDSHARVMALIGLDSIEPAEGMESLEKLMSSDVRQLIVMKTLGGGAPAGASLTDAMTRHLAKRMAAPAPAVESRDLRASVPASAPAAQRHAAPARAAEEAGTVGSDVIRQVIIDTLSEVLRLDAAAIRGDGPLADYGVDSIIGVNFVRMLNEALEIELAPTKLFEYSTVDELAAYVATLSPPAAAAPPVVRQAVPVASRGVETDAAAALDVVAVSRFVRDDLVAADARPAVRESSVAVEPIAVIGMSGRFALSENLDAFWQHLAQGTDLVRPVSRWSADDCAPPGTNGGYCAHASSIDSIDRFDAAFFGIAPEEAKYMDPQQRLFLEESWRALEDAAYAGRAMHEKQCGVYVGCGTSNYSDLFGTDAPPQAWWGNSQSIVPARIAYHLNLQGPAVAVDSACSSALVAIHMACQALWSRETEMALAGGVYLQATAGFHQIGNRAGMLSPDGRCYSFDARANGFVPGEAVGVVVLKRLADALRDGDHIHAVIAASGINQDGRSNGLTAPNGRAQERLERSVYERFGIDPESIRMVEAHGTGTLLGDSIEHAAIARAFGERTDRKAFCAIGSVKTNIGHAGNAAGIASVLKLLLSLRHRRIPPSLHFEKSNPAIDFESSPFYVNTELRDWPAEGDRKRRGAVSSFGFSGTNAHLVIEEAPSIARANGESAAHLIVLSARKPEELRQQARSLAAAVKNGADLSLNDVSFTLFAGRMHLSHRLACVARSREELVDRLEQWLENGAAQQVVTGEVAEGRTREQAALRRFGNYCIRECRESSDAATVLESLAAVAELYVQGYALDFRDLFPRDSRRVPLPTYPFAGDRHWVDGAIAPRTLAPAASARFDEAAAPTVEPAWLFSKGDASGAGKNGSMTAAEKIELFLKQETALQLRKPLDEIPIDRSYFDLGLSSLSLAHLIRNLNRLLDEELSPSALFDYTDIRSLADFLAQTYAARLDLVSVARRNGNAQEHAVEERLPDFANAAVIAGGEDASAIAVAAEHLPIAAPAAADPLSEQMLARVLWQDDATLDGTYEKVTF